MHWVGFKPTIPAFERANSVHALERAATVKYKMFRTEPQQISPNSFCVFENVIITFMVQVIDGVEVKLQAFLNSELDGDEEAGDHLSLLTAPQRRSVRVHL
jgi:hypothetical protein